MPKSFNIKIQDILEENLGTKITDEMYKNTPENLSTTHSKEQGANPFDYTIHSMADLLQGKPAYGSIQDTLGRFEETMSSALGGFFGEIEDAPVLNHLIPDDVHAMLLSNAPNVDGSGGDNAEDESQDNGGSSAPGSPVAKTAKEIISLAKSEVGYSESPPNSNETKFARIAGVQNGLAWCFGAGTLVATPQGSIPIEYVSVGDAVYSASMKQCFVSAVAKRVKETLLISVDGLTTTTTSEHPYWASVKVSDGKYLPPQWVEAGELMPGDMLYSPNNNYWVLVEYIEKGSQQDVYNLTVDDDNTFIADNLAVHNCSTFLKAMFVKAGHPQSVLITPSTEETLDNFMEINRVGQTPKYGALVFFLFPGNRAQGRRVNHIGIVYDWNDQFVKSCDGNSQPLWSNILTPTGWKRMGDIKPGDAVCDPDGEDSQVEAVYPQGVLPVYRLTLSDGSTAYASEDHLWRTQDIFQSDKVKVQTTGQIAQRTTTVPRCRVGPIIPPDIHSEEEISVDPYLLGILIGDGTLQQEKIHVSSIDEEIVESIKQLLPDNTRMVHYGGKGNCDYAIYGTEHSHNPLLRPLRELGLIGKTAPYKFVPERYFNIPAEQRLRLLRGLMDSDGDADSRNRANFTTSSEQLIKDVVRLVRSLGGRTNYNISAPKTWTSPYQPVKQTGRRSFRAYVSIHGTNPFSLTRKAERITRDPKRYTGFSIKEIEYMGDYECQCIQVSAESGMYITDDYIPTHNTSGDNERNGGKVALRTRPRGSGSLVQYYAYPDYVDTGSSNANEESPEERRFSGNIGENPESNSVWNR